MEDRKYISFGKAMDALNKGYKVTKAGWKGYWFKPKATFYKGSDGKLHKMLPMLLAHLKDGLGTTVAMPYNVDMQNDKWYIVK